MAVPWLLDQRVKNSPTEGGPANLDDPPARPEYPARRFRDDLKRTLHNFRFGIGIVCH